MWRRVDLVWTDVSEKCIASIFMVEKFASEPPAHAASSLADFSTMKMKATRSSETSFHTTSTRRHIPEDGILHSHRRENLKSYIILISSNNVLRNLVWSDYNAKSWQYIREWTCYIFRPFSTPSISRSAHSQCRKDKSAISAKYIFRKTG
jgi:hypothetical protein